MHAYKNRSQGNKIIYDYKQTHAHPRIVLIRLSDPPYQLGDRSYNCITIVQHNPPKPEMSNNMFFKIIEN